MNTNDHPDDGDEDAPPPTIFRLLIGLGLSCSLLAGYSMAGAKT